MRKLLIMMSVLFSFTSIASVPKFKVGTCFRVSPYEFYAIGEVTKTSYIVDVISLIHFKRQYKFEIFENKIEEHGLIAESCEKIVEDFEKNEE